MPPSTTRKTSKHRQQTNTNILRPDSTSASESCSLPIFEYGYRKFKQRATFTGGKTKPTLLQRQADEDETWTHQTMETCCSFQPKPHCSRPRCAVLPSPRKDLLNSHLWLVSKQSLMKLLYLWPLRFIEGQYTLTKAT